MGRSAPRVGHNTTTPSPHCAVRMLRGMSADTPRDESARAARTGFERGDNALPKPVPPTCRGVGAVEPRPTAWGGARPALAHNTTTPSPRTARRVLHGRSADTPQGEKRAGRAPRDLNAVTKTFQSRAADLSRCWCGRSSADGVGRSAPRVGPQHNHAKSALRGACSVGGRPILHGAKRARAARHGIQTR